MKKIYKDNLNELSYKIMKIVNKKVWIYNDINKFNIYIKTLYNQKSKLQ